MRRVKTERPKTNQQRKIDRRENTEGVAMKTSSPKSELPTSNRVRKVAVGGSRPAGILTFLERCGCGATLAGLIAANAQSALINGYDVNPRIFNDNPGSTLTITPAAPINANPATITIRDEFTGAFSGANRHDVIASADGGVTSFNH